MKRLTALLLALLLVVGLAACGGPGGENSNSPEPSPSADPVPSPSGEQPPAGPVVTEGTMTQIVTVNLLGNDVPVTLVRNFDTGAYRIDYQFNGNDVYAEGFVTEDGLWEIVNTNNDFTFGTIEAVIPAIDETAWVASDSELVVEVPVVEPMADPVDRAEYGIPNNYTKVKIFVGTYGFGDAEIVAAFNDDETAFYLTFVCFDETQIVYGTINNGIAMVEYDLTGFMSADAQLICDDAFASDELWAPLTGEAASGSDDTPVDETPVAQTVTVDMMGNATEVYVVKTGNQFELNYAAMGNDVVITGTIEGDAWVFGSSNVEAVAAFAGNIINSVVAAIDESAWAPVEAPAAEAVCQTVTVDMMGNATEVYVVKTGNQFELNYAAMGNDVVITGTIEGDAWVFGSSNVEAVANFAGNIIDSVVAAIDDAAWAPVE